MERKHIGSIVIGVAIILVFYMWATKWQSVPHAVGEEWLRSHKVIVQRNGNPDRFCIKCHKKQGQNKDNFCNACHVKQGIKKVQ